MQHGRGQGKLDFWTESASEDHRRSGLSLGLLGEHQACNAATSLAVISQLRALGYQIGDDAETRGIADANCPARVELVTDSPPTIVDAAHNVASCQALVATLRKAFPDRPMTLIFATSRDKDAAGMLSILLPHFRRVFLTQYCNNPRAVPTEELLLAANRVIEESQLAAEPESVEILAASEPEDAWRRATADRGTEELVCITGSFFLAAELRTIASRS
jgi:dihydrofolate synthase/folylpolyglutamate synthase